MREQAEEADTQSIGHSLQESGMIMDVCTMRGVFSMMSVGRKEEFTLLKFISEGHFLGRIPSTKIKEQTMKSLDE